MANFKPGINFLFFLCLLMILIWVSACGIDYKARSTVSTVENQVMMLVEAVPTAPAQTMLLPQMSWEIPHLIAQAYAAGTVGLSNQLGEYAQGYLAVSPFQDAIRVYAPPSFVGRSSEITVVMAGPTETKNYAYEWTCELNQGVGNNCYFQFNAETTQVLAQNMATLGVPYTRLQDNSLWNVGEIFAIPNPSSPGLLSLVCVLEVNQFSATLGVYTDMGCAVPGFQTCLTTVGAPVIGIEFIMSGAAVPVTDANGQPIVVGAVQGFNSLSFSPLTLPVKQLCATTIQVSRVVAN